MNEYDLCGWRILSEVPLPEIPPWSGAPRLPDITIRLSPLPDRLGRAIDISPILQITHDGASLLTIPNVAKYLLTSASDILIDPDPRMEQLESIVHPDLVEFLLGPMFGLLCLGRGLFPLHGSTVNIGGRAIILVGAAGSGKSTLAAALVRRGHALVSDDLCLIDRYSSGIPMVLPTFPRVKLWRDRSTIIDRESQDAILGRVGREPFSYDFLKIENFHPAPLPAHAFYHVTNGYDADSDTPSISPLTGKDRLTVLDRNLYGKRVTDALGTTPVLFEAAHQIVNATRMSRFVRGRIPDTLDEMVTRIEADAAL